MARSPCLVLALLLTAGLATAGVRPAAAADKLVLGEYGSLTGSDATFGTSTRDGVALAIKELNAKGGVKGRLFEVVVYDDQGKAQEAATTVTKLITQDKVLAVIGEVASSRSLAAAPICQARGVPMISPSSTNPGVTDVGDYIFRVCFIDPFQGSVMAAYAFNQLQARKVAIFRDMRNAYSVGLADFFIDTFTKLGGTIVTDESYASGDSNYKSQLITIRGYEPDAIYVPGFYTEVALIARQAKGLGVNQPLLGGDGWDSAALAEIGGKAMDGNYFSNHYSTEDPSPEIQGFIHSFKKEYGQVPDALAALAYDATLLIADAIGRIDGDDVTPAKIRDNLARTRDFPGVTGHITMDAQRNAAKPAVVLKVEAGQFKFSGSVDAKDIEHAVAQKHAPPPVGRRGSAHPGADFLQHLVEGASLGASYALVALGYTMVYGILAFINFAHSDVFMLGAFFAFYAARAFGGALGPFGGVLVALVVAMLGCGLVGFAIERIAYRPLRQSPKLTVLITAIGVSLLLENGGQLVFGAAPQGFPPLITEAPLVQIGLFTISRVQALGALTAVLLMLGLQRLIYGTKLGQAMRAVAQDHQVAALMGIPTDRIISMTFVVGAALAGAGGLIIGQTYGSIRPDMGIIWGLKAFVAAVIGGIGNIYGAVAGGLLLGLSEELASAYLSSSMRDAIAFALLIAVLLFRPAGLLGRATREKV